MPDSLYLPALTLKESIYLYLHWNLIIHLSVITSNAGKCESIFQFCMIKVDKSWEVDITNVMISVKYFNLASIEVDHLYFLSSSNFPPDSRDSHSYSLYLDLRERLKQTAANTKHIVRTFPLY